MRCNARVFARCSPGVRHSSFRVHVLLPIRRAMGRRAFMGIAFGAAIAITGACASKGSHPQPFPTPPESSPSGANSAREGVFANGFTIATAALQLQGIPYRLGGTDVHGFDCSGLVQYVFALYGVAVP